MQETWVQPLGQEDPLAKEMATVSLRGKSQGQRSLAGQQTNGHDLATKQQQNCDCFGMS